MKKLTAVKRFVDNHRTGIAVATTVAAATYIHVRVIQNVNEELVKRGIDPMEFHNSEEE